MLKTRTLMFDIFFVLFCLFSHSKKLFCSLLWACSIAAQNRPIIGCFRSVWRHLWGRKAMLHKKPTEGLLSWRTQARCPGVFKGKLYRKCQGLHILTVCHTLYCIGLVFKFRDLLGIKVWMTLCWRDTVNKNRVGNLGFLYICLKDIRVAEILTK